MLQGSLRKKCRTAPQVVQLPSVAESGQGNGDGAESAVQATYMDSAGGGVHGGHAELPRGDGGRGHDGARVRRDLVELAVGAAHEEVLQGIAKGLEINKLVAFVSLEAIDSHAGWDCVVEGKAIIFV